MNKLQEIKETFPPGVTKAEIDKEAQLKLKSGAISSTPVGSEAEGWTLITIYERL